MNETSGFLILAAMAIVLWAMAFYAAKLARREAQRRRLGRLAALAIVFGGLYFCRKARQPSKDEDKPHPVYKI